MIAGIGLGIVVIAGEIDVSIGSLVGAVAIPLIVVMNKTGSMELGIAARCCSRSSSESSTATFPPMSASTR